jgi:hypothetical protein
MNQNRGFRCGRVHAAALLIEDTKIVLTVGNTEFSRLAEPTERRCFIERRAFAAREIDAEIVHGAAIAGCSRALSPLTRDREIGRDAFAALIELGQTILRHREAAIGSAAQHRHALSRAARGDALQREFVLRGEIASLARLAQARRCAPVVGRRGDLLLGFARSAWSCATARQPCAACWRLRRRTAGAVSGATPSVGASANGSAGGSVGATSLTGSRRLGVSLVRVRCLAALHDSTRRQSARPRSSASSAPQHDAARTA